MDEPPDVHFGEAFHQKVSDAYGGVTGHQDQRPLSRGELDPGQGNRLSLPFAGVGVRIKGEIPRGQPLHHGVGNSPQYGPGPGCQFLRIKWLHHVIIGAHVKTRDSIPLTVPRDEHDDGNIGATAHTPTQLSAGVMKIILLIDIIFQYVVAPRFVPGPEEHPQSAFEKF